MWSLLIKAIRFLFSRAMVIIIVAALVIGAVALWFFAQNHLDQRREDLAAAEQQLQTLTTEIGEHRAQLQTLATDRQATLDAIQTVHKELDTQTQEIQKRAERTAANIKKTNAEITEISGRMESLAQKLSQILGPLETTNWLPDVLQNQAAKWRESLNILGTQRQSLEDRTQSLKDTQATLAARTQDLTAQAKTKGEELGVQLRILQTSSQETRTQLTPLQQDLSLQQQTVTDAKRRLADDERFIQESTYWLQKSWETVRWYLFAAILAWLFGPFLIRTLLYYLWAPLIEIAPPIRLHQNPSQPIHVGSSHPAQKILLEPHEIAIVHERYLQSSDEPLRRRTQWLWSWRFPLTSLATGMVLMTRLSNRPVPQKIKKAAKNNPTDAPITPKHQPAQITLSSQDDESVELAIVEIPPGAYLTCRPRFIAGIIHHPDEIPQIRSRWVFFRLHSWITLQFRYFIFEGPVKLILAAGRGVQVEEIDGRSRRTNEDLTIAFQPQLNYRSRRCETFIAYLRGQNPLFDDQFQGEGTFLGQQVRRGTKDGEARHFWKDFFGLFFKALGI